MAEPDKSQATPPTGNKRPHKTVAKIMRQLSDLCPSGTVVPHHILEGLGRIHATLPEDELSAKES